MKNSNKSEKRRLKFKLALEIAQLIEIYGEDNAKVNKRIIKLRNEINRLDGVKVFNRISSFNPDEYMKLYNQGLNITPIARTMGFTVETIKKHVYRLGLPYRSSKKHRKEEHMKNGGEKACV